MPCCPDCRACYGTCARPGKPASCADLNKAYRAAVQRAKSCCATCAEKDPCTLKVWDSLPSGCPCSCETFVNANNAADLQEMNAMERQWTLQGCGPGLPPPATMACCALYPACGQPKTASCGGAGLNGSCEDSFGK